MHALYHLADARLDARLITQIGYVLASFANDDTRLLGRDNSAQGQVGDGVLLVCLGRGQAIWAKVVVDLQVVHFLVVGIAIGRHRILGNGHDESGRRRGCWLCAGEARAQMYKPRNLESNGLQG